MQPSSSSPALVLIDVQNEYVSEGRPFFLKGAGPSLENCRKLLQAARRAGARVIHIQHLGDGAAFRRGTPEADFIPGFAPLPGETHLVKSKLSSYANDSFAPAVEAAAPAPVYVAGYGSTMCCMATIAAAPLHDQKLTLVHDASWARAGGGLSEEELHRSAVVMAGIHGAVASTEEALAAFASAEPPAVAAE